MYAGALSSQKTVKANCQRTLTIVVGLGAPEVTGSKALCIFLPDGTNPE